MTSGWTNSLPKQNKEGVEPGSWWDIHSAASAFGLAAGYTRGDVRLAFRRLALKAHPDLGGSQDAFKILVAQRNLLLSQAGNDLLDDSGLIV